MGPTSAKIDPAVGTAGFTQPEPVVCISLELSLEILQGLSGVTLE